MHPALSTPLCDLCGIRLPILLAPMANGPSTPELAAAVTRAGGLGVLAVSGLTAEVAADEVARARAACDGGPIGVNVQLAPPTPATGDRAAVSAVLAPFRAELGLPPEPPSPPPADAPAALIEAALAAGAAVVTTFDDPTPVLDMTRRAEAVLIAMVTTVDEARWVTDLGADAVIAQGGEAGGHRGTFGAGTPGTSGAATTGTMALIPAAVDAVGGSVPVIASGGIADGRGIAAALALGAAGVSLGTRFLVAEEAGVPPVYRRLVRETAGDRTVVTDAVTGRPARWIRSRVVDALVEARAGNLGWGPQGAIVRDIRRAALEQGRADLAVVLAGEASSLAGADAPAEAIVADLVRETSDVLRRLAG
jgi:nitronate monooxygenase